MDNICSMLIMMDNFVIGSESENHYLHSAHQKHEIILLSLCVVGFRLVDFRYVVWIMDY